MYYRPTSLGLALCQAALKNDRPSDPPNESNWVQRRIVLNMDRERFGVVKERDNNHLRFKTAMALKQQGIL